MKPINYMPKRYCKDLKKKSLGNEKIFLKLQKVKRKKQNLISEKIKRDTVLRKDQ